MYGGAGAQQAEVGGGASDSDDEFWDMSGTRASAGGARGELPG